MKLFRGNDPEPTRTTRTTYPADLKKSPPAGTKKSYPLSSQDRPTAKQLALAAKLKISTDGLSKFEVSQAITAKIGKSKSYTPKPKISDDPELVKLERYWEDVAENDHFGITMMIWEVGKTIKVDIVQIHAADIVGAKKRQVELLVCVPKLKKDRHIGEVLEWETERKIKTGKVLHSEVLNHDIDFDDVNLYQSTMKKALKIAEKFK